MEKELKIRFSLKDMFKAFGDLMWNSEDVIEEDENLPETLKKVSDKITKKAEKLTEIELKTKNKKISKNIKTQNQLLNRSAKSKNIDKEDREREE